MLRTRKETRDSAELTHLIIEAMNALDEAPATDVCALLETMAIRIQCEMGITSSEKAERLVEHMCNQQLNRIIKLKCERLILNNQG